MAYPEAVQNGGVQVSLTASTNEKFGDYQCNAAMPLSQYYKRVGQVVDDCNINRVDDTFYLALIYLLGAF